MKEIKVSTGDIKKNYEVIGPVYFQVSNKGLFGSTLETLKRKYSEEIAILKSRGEFSPSQADWGFLYGEWSVGQDQFDEAFYICVRELQDKARSMGGDAIIWLRQDIDLDTVGFAHFYLQMYGTVVRIDDNGLDNYRLQRVIDEKYLEIVLKDNTEAALNIKEKKTNIKSQENEVKQKEQAWNDKKEEIKERCKKIDVEITSIDKQIADIQATIIKLTSYGRATTSSLVSKKRDELQHAMNEKKRLEINKKNVVLDGEPLKEEYVAAYDKLRVLKKELNAYEDSL